MGKTHLTVPGPCRRQAWVEQKAGEGAAGPLLPAQARRALESFSEGRGQAHCTMAMILAGMQWALAGLQGCGCS